MELPRVLVAILGFFKFLWAFFFTKNKSIEPFRFLDLPSLAHDVVFSEMQIKELYHLSKCSRRTRYAVKMFTRRQKYEFEIHACKLFCYLKITNRFDIKTFCQPRDKFSLLTDAKDVWPATKKEIIYCFDVFTKNVELWFFDSTLITKMAEVLKEETPLLIDRVRYDAIEMDDEMYKSLLREYKNAKKLTIRASPSADFRFDDMEPFTGDELRIKDADWLTVDNLSRCFTNVQSVRLGFGSRRCLNVHVFNQFLNEWRNGLRVGKLDLECQWTDFDLQSIFKNVPTTQVKRAEVRNCKRVFKDGQCFLIRQKESGVEAIVYFNFNGTSMNRKLCFTTNFRLLRDEKSDEERRWPVQ